MRGPSQPGESERRPARDLRGPLPRYDAATVGWWLFIAIEVALFGGLFWLYAVHRIGRPEPLADDGRLLDAGWGVISTAVLIIGSLLVALAVRSARCGHRWQTVLLLALALVCAVDFLGVKVIEYRATPATARQLLSFPFLLIGTHAMHVLAGVGVLTWLAVRADRGRLVGRHLRSIELGGLYWHCVGLIWVFFFPLLYLVG